MLSKIKFEKPKDYLIGAMGAFALLYLINPSAGVFEIIPDNIPLVGNLDEGLATTLLLSCLNYFGYNSVQLFKK
jgi:uncharacterized membrane protein YkvA (DUF1232 family)